MEYGNILLSNRRWWRQWQQEAQLPKRYRETRYVGKFLLCFTRYGS